ncbi:unnamed protein product [Adineta steineri]|uniref:Nuclear receptor domain-containing protein n=1 Tax=Adineta steineri TaxID=433720 RepID=A0A814QN99_9BILA|nr:unnamed protein product [Adineta steineri]
MNKDLIIVRQTTTSLRDCKVCGASARYSYYGAIVCQSCKMFFRRHALTEQTLNKCVYDNKCEINISNRRKCLPCRLAKCFANGMHTEMLRSCHSHNNTLTKKRKLIDGTISIISTPAQIINKKSPPEQISTLSYDQWNLLSTLVYSFDEYSRYSLVEQFIEDQNTLPVKLRFKHSIVTDFFTSIMSKIQLVYEKHRDILSLSHDDRSILFRKTVEYTSSISGIYVLRQTKLLDDFTFSKSSEIIFQPIGMIFIKRIIDQLDHNDTFIKLIFAVIAFSTINYTVYRQSTSMNLINIKSILSIQDIYVKLTWQYLLNQCNHTQAVLRFTKLIRCLLLVISMTVEAHESKEFTKMINSVIEQTQQTFCY